MAIYLTLDVAAGITIGVVRESFGTVEVLACERSGDTRHHAENLTPMVHDALRTAHITTPDIVVVGTGPAAFTGLRAGLVTAQTLATVWQVPIYGLSSLEILARAGMDEGANVAVAIIDARRKEVYALRARAMGPDDLEVLEPPRVLTPAVLTDEIARIPAVPVTHESDAELYADLFPDASHVAVSPAVAVRLLRSRQARAEAGESGAATDFSTQPQYLRRPDVHSGAKAQPRADGNPYALGEKR
ncbi:MAG: tRNA (adenosine(37)-N6)-threonylcarbamoyltransferase complex dimerization subunit type 1 TsaB [Actinomycetaceae bacterium]|nr:tRNA (adenosine(37)-N6)-threonylcarbamoyltransferase complex dimerization subunit type 1 TsaB [Actinomycetaceae bacterium]MDY5854632.1 tRNA (adenosine(37)-N6)-threonylcarbamoyltransferase complex dimerization subunit type 1 TsaB [Arcanobacterium sp.]